MSPYWDTACSLTQTMTLPSFPTQFLAHGKAHNAQTRSQPCQELKMPTHNPHTPADGILISF